MAWTLGRLPMPSRESRALSVYNKEQRPTTTLPTSSRKIPSVSPLLLPRFEDRTRPAVPASYRLANITRIQARQPYPARFFSPTRPIVASQSQSGSSSCNQGIANLSTAVHNQLTWVALAGPRRREETNNQRTKDQGKRRDIRDRRRSSCSRFKAPTFSQSPPSQRGDNVHGCCLTIIALFCRRRRQRRRHLDHCQ